MPAMVTFVVVGQMLGGEVRTPATPTLQWTVTVVKPSERWMV